MTSRRTILMNKQFMVSASRERIFSFLIDPKNTSQWLPELKYVSHRPRGEVEVGSEVLCRVSAFGFTRNATFRFSAIDPPSFFRSEGTSSGVAYRSEFLILGEDTEMHSTLNWKIEIKLPKLLPLGGQLVSNAMSKDMDKGIERIVKILMEPGSNG